MDGSEQNEPRGQGTAKVEFAGQYWPDTHAVKVDGSEQNEPPGHRTAYDEFIGQYCPGTQAWTVDGSEQNEPLGHRTAEDELAGQCCPNTHFVGNTERKGQTYPASHIRLTLELGQKEPSAHGDSHVDAGGQKLPRLHGANDTELHKYPAGHTAQLTPSSEYHPIAQGKHGGGMLGIKARLLPAKKEPPEGIIGFT